MHTERVKDNLLPFFFFLNPAAVPEPEQPVRSYPLWVREEGEVDPEPVYIAPHFESYHANRSPSLSESQSPLSPKESGSTDVQTGQSTPVSSPKLSEVPSEVRSKLY